MQHISQHLCRVSFGIAAALSVTFFISRPVAAIETEAARTLVQDAASDILVSFAGKTLNDDDSQAAMRMLVDRYFDMDVESQQILGRYWGLASLKQHQEFEGLLERYFVSVLGGMIHGLPANQNITVQSAARDGNKVVVQSLVYVPHNPASAVQWVVMDGSKGRPVITDVSVEGVALVNTLSDDFTAVVRNASGRLEALSVPLRKKVESFSSPSEVGAIPIPNVK